MLSVELQAALSDLKAQGLPATPTGRPASRTRRRRPLDQRPRLARRFIPRQSLQATLDWDLTDGEARCLAFLMSLPRVGVTIHHVSAGSIAAQLGRHVSTVRDYLRGLDEREYLLTRKGRERGSLVIFLAPKATRWCQLGPGDIARGQKSKRPANPPVSARKSGISLAYKDNQKKEAKRVPVDKAMPALARIAALARAAAGTPDAAYWQRRYNDLAESARKAALE